MRSDWSKKTIVETEQKSIPKVSIQGIEGSFHHIAALKYFGEEVIVQSQAHFRDVVKSVAESNEYMLGMMAIENSIAGSILPNYQLVQNSGLKITGEVYLPVTHHLFIHPTNEYNEIEEVHSHPMALLQCMQFLRERNWMLVEKGDTALSALEVMKHPERKAAAICSLKAGEVYGLKLVASDIHTMKTNYTRFWVISRDEHSGFDGSVNKASIHFRTDNSFGILAKILTKIAQHGINLSKLQSFPVPGTEFEYGFHADLEFEILDQLHQTIYALESLTKGLTIYGIYEKGDLSFNQSV